MQFRSEFAVLAAFPIILVLAVDIWLLQYGTSDAFQRAGSLIVVFAVLLVGRSVRAIQKQETDARMLFLRDEGDITFGREAAELHLRLVTANAWMTLSEIALIVIGTVQWGYGDLLHSWVR